MVTSTIIINCNNCFYSNIFFTDTLDRKFFWYFLFDLYFYYKNEITVNLFLCHQNNWFQDQIKISLDEKNKLITVFFKNQRIESFEQFSFNQNTIIKKTLGVCG